MPIRLSRNDIIQGLTELVAELKHNNISTDLYLVGGAALVLKYFDRRLTSDVDLRSANFAEVQSAVETIALRHGWDSDWVNNAASIFVPTLGTDVVWEKIFDDGNVTVSVASPEALLAMKLAASRTGRDDDDIAQLLSITGLTNLVEIEELFEEYFPGDVLPMKAYKLLEKIFEVGIPNPPQSPPPPQFE